MRRATSGQKNFELLARVFKAMLTNTKIVHNDPDPPPSADTWAKFGETMDKIIERAEQGTGLDIDLDLDRTAFVLAAACALYNPNGRGSSVKWDEVRSHDE